MSDDTKFFLPEDRIPRAWYNIMADMPEPPAPVLHPGTGQPIGPDDLAPLFPMALIGQEVSVEREIEIPTPVRDVYRLWRPAPLFRARRLERALDTPARIYYKYEGVSPSGSHKPNTAVAQAFYNREEGTKRLVTETGAGQWGSSLAFAGNLFGLPVDVYMVRISFDQKPYRRAAMETYGARCVASPSNETESGRAILAETPDSTGSLGIAISEAVEVAAQNDDAKYALGSVLNHVLLHQTVIGLEAIEQMEMADDDPDVIIGCAGGGSNFAGLAFPFLGQQFRGGRARRYIAVEPMSCPTMTKGSYAYDFGDTAHLTPLVKMHTLGSGFVPPVSMQGACAITVCRRWSAVWSMGVWSRPKLTSRPSVLQPVWNSPAPKASFRPRNRPTPSKRRSKKRRDASKRAWPGQSCLTCPATAISICRPIPTISLAS